MSDEKEATAYVVLGDTSHDIIWAVAAYVDRADAEKHAAAAKEWATENWDKGAGAGRGAKTNPWDPKTMADGYNTEYSVMSVPLFFAFVPR